MRTRIIPTLLLKGTGLVKTARFRQPVYIGDPINCVRIFNEKEVDELCFLDISEKRHLDGPQFDLLAEIASECFMPLSYGGGVSSLEIAKELTFIGFEKIIINSAAYTNPVLVKNLANKFGSSAVVGSIDVKKNWRGKEGVYINSGQEKIAFTPEAWARELEFRGVGEIMINSIDKDGEMTGYDFALIERIVRSVSVPVIAAGGASSMGDFRKAVNSCGASAVSAGAMFVYYGKHRAVLITYPNQSERSGF